MAMRRRRSAWTVFVMPAMEGPIVMLSARLLATVKMEDVYAQRDTRETCVNNSTVQVSESKNINLSLLL